jgi:hypothetical protein
VVKSILKMPGNQICIKAIVTYLPSFNAAYQLRELRIFWKKRVLFVALFSKWLAFELEEHLTSPLGPEQTRG